jgi:hypothetical protein
MYAISLTAVFTGFTCSDIVSIHGYSGLMSRRDVELPCRHDTEL